MDSKFNIGDHVMFTPFLGNLAMWIVVEQWEFSGMNYYILKNLDKSAVQQDAYAWEGDLSDPPRPQKAIFKLYRLNVDGDRDELEGEYNSRYDAVTRATEIMYEDCGGHMLRLGGDGMFMVDLWFTPDEDYAVLEIVEEKA